MWEWRCVCDSVDLSVQVGDVKGKAKEVLEESRKNVDKAAETLRRTQLDLDQYGQEFQQQMKIAQSSLQVTAAVNICILIPLLHAHHIRKEIWCQFSS